MLRNFPLAGVALLIGLGLRLGHANLIQNGSFELPPLSPFTVYTYGVPASGAPGGDTLPGNWVVTQGTVDVASFGGYDGPQFLDLHGWSQGGVRQTVNISVAGTYTFSFAYATYFNVAGTRGMQVTVLNNGNPVFQQSYSFTANNDGTFFPWQVVQTQFNLVSGTATVIFESLGSNEDGVGVFVDDVQLVPEPASMLVLAGGVVSLLALRRRRT